MNQVARIQTGVVIENTKTNTFFVVMEKTIKDDSISLDLLPVEEEVSELQQIDFQEFNFDDIVTEDYNMDELEKYISDGIINVWIEQSPFKMEFVDNQMRMAA